MTPTSIRGRINAFGTPYRRGSVPGWLNLAIADVSVLAPALIALIKKHDPELADAYSHTALQRVWRCTHFSWGMTSMLHISGDPFDAELQRSQLRWVFGSRAAAMGLAENYAGLPLGVG
jgi:p-hydroxybenzoate 3-monooxygenase